MNTNQSDLILNSDSTLDQPYLHLLDSVKFTPIFVLGFARSGTTLLNELLIKNHTFNFFDFYHASKYPELLYNHLNGKEIDAYRAVDQFLEKLGMRDRGLDGIAINAKAPQEYISIQAMHNFIPSWSLFNQLWQLPRKIFLQQSTTPFFSQYILSDQTLPLFIQACKKLQFISNNQLPLLLKNPWDFSNFIYLKQRFPQAKFIFIHRHPVYVINSQLKALRQMLSEKNPFVSELFPDYNLLFEQPLTLALLQNFVMADFWEWSRVEVLGYLRSQVTEYYLENIGSLQPSDYISIRYEDLCTHPDQVRDSILAFLGQTSEGSWRDAIQPRSLGLLPELEKRSDYIRQKFQPYMQHFNYE